VSDRNRCECDIFWAGEGRGHQLAIISFISNDIPRSFAKILFEVRHRYLIIDPPGIEYDGNFLEQMVALALRNIVPLFCALDTQTCDLRILVSKYQAKDMQPIHMSPQMPYIEMLPFWRCSILLSQWRKFPRTIV
jgi:tRNA/tmRNA/rRNA uracil-C5-methylase (TrmA/RlmC/RlmD family)